ncbi:MAG TPA: PfkB family carbohydrate kinase [Saprospiraceae bacterium]|nr:PfkB family carbohydrate kinase [Saprospiraceae bacterium]
MSLLVIGSVAFDDIQTPYGHAEKIVGGAGTFIAWSASYFAHDIRMVSIVGEDFPLSELEALKERGVDTSGIKIVEGGKSFFWAGRYFNNLNSRETLVTDLNVLADFDPVLPPHFRDSEYVMLGNLTPSIQLKVIQQMAHRPKVIALDTMNYWMDSAMDELLEVLTKIDLLIINDEEARQLSGEYSLLKASEVISKMGPKYLVIKKGEHGALLFGEGRVFFSPALLLTEVIDPTGAGDTFAGGLMGYLAGQKELDFEILKQAITCGSAMASFCVEKFGTEGLRHISQEELSERVERFAHMVQFQVPGWEKKIETS